MIGNQLYVNRKALEHSDNMIKDIKDVTKEQIIETINDLYWKEWRSVLIKSETPIIEVSGLGTFDLQMSRGKNYARELMRRIRRNIKRKPNMKPLDGSMVGGIQNTHLENFRILWKQIDKLRYKWIERTKIINEYYRKTNQSEKIRIKYEL